MGITVEKVSIFRWQMRKNLYFFRQEIRKLCAPANIQLPLLSSFPRTQGCNLANLAISLYHSLLI